MKKSILLIIGIAINNLYAQFNKGNYIINSNFSYNNDIIDDNGFTSSGSKFYSVYNNVTSKKISLVISKFVRNNISTGISLSLTQQKSINKNEFGNIKEYRSRSDNFSLGVHTRKYIKIRENHLVYFMLYSNVGKITYSYLYRDSILHDPLFANGITANVLINSGYIFFINDKWCINLSIGDVGWNFQKYLVSNLYANTHTVKTSSVNFDFNSLALNIGLSYRVSKSNSNKE